VETLRYVHRNPVKRGLVELPERRRWSSYRFHLLDEPGAMRINKGWGEISFRGQVA
jgi:putative transposase